ncbi:MAG: hypothetical protein AAGD14_18325 [Planctomycetota bacterium]
MRPLFVLLLLALPAPAGELPLRQFFDPQARAFRLPALDGPEFRALDATSQAWARGFAPGTWFEPPAFDDAIPQAHSPLTKLYAGFAYRTRLHEKQRFWLLSVRHRKLDDALRQLERLPLDEPADFVRRYGHLAQGVDGPLRVTQVMLALRHSERMFRDWWTDELGRAIKAADGGARRRAIRRLNGALRHKERAVAVGAARVLGWLQDDEARAVAERAIARLDDPDVRAELVRARIRQGGPRVPALARSYVQHIDARISRTAIATLEADTQPWSLDLLQDCITNAKHRRFDDLDIAIVRRNEGEPDFEGDIDFYGLRTHSRKLLFVIDVSISMGFPMDGKDGTREPRRRRTIRELQRTLEKLPDDAAFNILFFSGRLTPLWRRLRPASAKHKQEALAFVRRSPLEAGTDVMQAMGAALRTEADTVFLLGDGEPSMGLVLDPALILHEVAARNRWGALRIHAVGLSRDQNVELLSNLARASGGQFLAVR